MKAISVRQPWAHAIVHMGKTVENRTWATKYRGPLAIHASGSMSAAEYRRFGEFVEEERIGRVPARSELQLGGIIGIADLVSCVDWSTSRWFFGPHAFVLRNVRPVPFVPVKGGLNLWAPDASVRRALGV